MAHRYLVIDGGVLWFGSTEAEDEGSRLSCPKNEATWEVEEGSGIRWIASIFDWRGAMPLAVRRNPTKSMAVVNVHFSAFSVKLCSMRALATLFRWSLCVWISSACTTMSSKKTATPGIPAKMVVITFWKQLGAELKPNSMHVYWCTPVCVTNAVRFLLEGWSGTCK